MTQQETRKYVMQLTTTLIQKKCYIKGFGDKMRIVDEQHNPLTNISKTVFNILVLNKIIRKEGLIYIIDTSANPFTHYLDVKLPIKE